MAKLTGEYFVEGMVEEERARAAIVESILPTLREHAVEVDQKAEFYMPHVKTLSDAGLLGLMVPKQYGGMGGGLRDLCAAIFAMATACPSTAMAYFFQCSATSRGVLLLQAVEAGLIDAADVAKATEWAEKVLTLIGKEGKWMGNFTSEGAKSEKAKLTIETTATTTEGGYIINGVKSFACSYGVADYYLVTASLQGTDDAAGLCTFIVDATGEGLGPRIKWDAVGLRGSATHGLVLDNVFVPESHSLAIPGAFVKSMQMSRGSFVGNQIAGVATYLGIAHEVYQYTLKSLQQKTYKDTGNPLGSNPVYQEMYGKMMMHFNTALLWMRRQLELETSEPPILPKEEVVKLWRVAKGTVAESAYEVGCLALKAAGTSGTLGTAFPSRALRDLNMGLVQAFPAERGRADAASTELSGVAEQQFTGVKK